jgi:hypothetical protein
MSRILVVLEELIKVRQGASCLMGLMEASGFSFFRRPKGLQNVIKLVRLQHFHITGVLDFQSSERVGTRQGMLFGLAWTYVSLWNIQSRAGSLV